MARLSAELVLGLRDNVSGPARKVEGTLDGLNRKVRQAQTGVGSRGPLGSPGMRPSVLDGPMHAAGGAEALLAARAAAITGVGVAAYAGAQAYTEFAEAERALTRTGIKLGADRQTMQAIRRAMGLIATKYAVPVQEVVQSFDSLAESGFELADARAALDGIVQATQGLGGSGKDTVNTFDAARKSIGLTQRDAERFFDIIAAGGAAGKFEGSDLARYLPSLLPVAARQGYQGLEGAARLVAFLEVMRDYVGSSEEAATATADIFEKISSPDVMKNFKKFGIDLEKRLGAARAEGKDVLLVLSDIIREATKGDATKLSQLFGDRDSRRAANVLLTAIDRVRDAQEKLRRESGGTIRANVDVVTEDAQAKIDNLSNAWNRFKLNVGAGIGKVATPVLDDLTDRMERGQAYEAGIARYEAQGGSKSEARAEFDRRYEVLNPDATMRQIAAAFVEQMAIYGRGEIANPYANIDRLLAQRASAERAKANGGRDPQAFGPYQPAPIDGQPVRRGLPVPGASVMSETEQRQSYGAGRVAEEHLSQRRDESSHAVARNIEATQARIAAAMGGGAPRPEAPPAAPSFGATGAPPPRKEPAERGGRFALGQSTGAVAIPTPRPDIERVVREEGERAAQAAETASQRISDAFSVTATTNLDTSALDAGIEKARTYLGILGQIAGKQAAIRNAPMPSAGTAGRAAPTRAWDRGGEFSDREP